MCNNITRCTVSNLTPGFRMFAFPDNTLQRSMFVDGRTAPLASMWPEDGTPVRAHISSEPQAATLSSLEGSDSDGCMPDHDPDSNNEDAPALTAVLHCAPVQNPESKALTERLMD